MADENARPGDLLGSLCSGAERLLLVAPYIKADALSRLLSNANPNVSLTCVTQWTLQDIAAGASDIRSWEIVKEIGGIFQLRPSLHAKYYRIDGTTLIGSANMTNSAMGWSPSPNLEILCQAGYDFDDSQFQRELFQQSREVGVEEYNRWRAILDSDILLAAKSSEQHPQVANWRPAARDFDSVLRVYLGRDNDVASLDEQAAAKRDLESLRIPDGLTPEQAGDWALTCLLASSFANSALQVAGMEEREAIRRLAQVHVLSLADARRSRETVYNWFASLAPEMLASAP